MPKFIFIEGDDTLEVTREYWEQLDAVASAPDDAFPELLMNPLFNPFEERYHEMDLDDRHNRAVDVDFRFTRARISRIRANTKRIDQYLEWIDLWEAYRAYLIDTYGSMEIVYALQKEGLFEDPVIIKNRPYLRKKSQRQMLAAGLVPSFSPTGYNVEDEAAWIRAVCDDDMPDVHGEEEPDVEWAARRKLTKSEERLLEQGALRYRQNMRLTTLSQGTKTGGIWAISDWVDDYYSHLARGDYDTSFSLGTKSNMDLVAAMQEINQERWMTESERIDKARGVEAGKARYFYNGSVVTKTDQQKEDEKEFIRDLYKHGIDLVQGMKRAGVPRKAIRKIYEELGIQTEGMTEKEIKKMEKLRKKSERVIRGIDKGNSALSEVLKTNRLLMGSDTIRFEDGHFI